MPRDSTPVPERKRSPASRLVVLSICPNFKKQPSYSITGGNRPAWYTCSVDHCLLWTNFFWFLLRFRASLLFVEGVDSEYNIFKRCLEDLRTRGRCAEVTRRNTYSLGYAIECP